MCVYSVCTGLGGGPGRLRVPASGRRSARCRCVRCGRDAARPPGERTRTSGSCPPPRHPHLNRQHSHGNAERRILAKRVRSAYAQHVPRAAAELRSMARSADIWKERAPEGRGIGRVVPGQTFVSNRANFVFFFRASAPTHSHLLGRLRPHGTIASIADASGLAARPSASQADARGSAGKAKHRRKVCNRTTRPRKREI